MQFEPHYSERCRSRANTTLHAKQNDVSFALFQNLVLPPRGDADLMKNVDATGESLERSQAHRDEIESPSMYVQEYTSAMSASETDTQASLVYGEHYLFP
ncbi:unnamed protein product [Larinioides sclopetarius]|uniref:Uncharacterized protein n=1 Tax=Larinioides sclopetarius TaxID=280406 RepID=A0AAV2BHW1_9ARAC